MSASIIVAASSNGVIGRDGQIPWHLPRDLQEFKRRTTGHAIIMGRKTFESIGKPLPNRHSIVLSRSLNALAPGVDVVRTIDEALEKASGDSSPFFIGGADVYRMAMPLVDRIFLTRVLVNVDGDTFFPDLPKEDWQCVSSESFQADEKNPHECVFEEYVRIANQTST